MAVTEDDGFVSIEPKTRSGSDASSEERSGSGVEQWTSRPATDMTGMA